MKKLLLVILFFVPFTGFAQHLPTQEKLFEGCTVIIIETTDKAPDAFKKVQAAFKEQGFTVVTTDKDIYMLIASQTLKGAGNVQVNAVINQAGNNQIILNGTLANEAATTAATASTGTKIANTGNNENPARVAFDKMHQVALSYKGKGAKILYGSD